MEKIKVVWLCIFLPGFFAFAGAGEARMTLDCGSGVTLKLVRIPAGTFLMGSPPSEKGTSHHEFQHEVTINRPFYIGVHEVTQAQYQAVMGTNPSGFKGDDLPVEEVSWDDAMEFCRRLSEKTRRTVRLPTEAEWEYACRAGTTTPFSFGETISTDRANYNGTYAYGNDGRGMYRRRTTPVGSFPANAHGLHDVHGNVWEWCFDWYVSYSTGDPIDIGDSEYRVLRGGAWNYGPVYCRSASRNLGSHDRHNNGIGFRVSMD